MPEEPTDSVTESMIATTPNGGPDATAEAIVRSHVMWSMGAGLIPLPLADLAGVTAIQMDALKQLAATYGVDYSEAGGKRFVTALAGGTVARVGASAVKLIPGIGSVIGGLSMSALSGASTYAICQVAINHFKTHGNFLELDIEDAKSAYRSALEKGKSVVTALKPKSEEARRLYEQISKLESLRDDEVLTEAEYEAKKSSLIAKIEGLGKSEKSDE